MKRLLLLYLILASSTCFAKRIYVNQLLTATGDGATWATAYKVLQTGFDVAKTGDTVLVAAGVYAKSTYNSLNTFRLYKGITILGGYPNTGNPTDAQRDWVNNPTILSGVTGDFGSSNDFFLIPNIPDPVVIDGIVMRDVSGSGLNIIGSAAVTVKNSLFENNWGSPISINNSQATFINCVMSKNLSGTLGNGANANTSLYNCVFVNNTSTYSSAIYNTGASLGIYNCTLVDNSGIAVSGAGTGFTVIRNSIIWGNWDRFSTGAIFDITSSNHTVQVSNSITQTYYDNNVNTLLVNQQPRFLNEAQPAGPDNKFFTADDGLQLTAPCSPALNYGDNSATGALTTDLIGNPRTFNNGTVDLGAYEMQQTPGPHFNTVFVNSNAGNTGTHDGSSWSNAFTTLQQALLYCADTIKMAAGTYLTTNSYADSVFSLEAGKVLIGGYPATGNPTDVNRNPQNYPTILKGNYSGTYTARYSPVLKVYHTTSAALLDGIQVTNYASTGTAYYIPAVAVNYGAILKVQNCDFRLDAARNIRSTGLSATASSITVTRCTFSNAYSETGGAAISCSNARATISYCNFQGAAAASTVVSAGNTSLTIDSCVFQKGLQDGNALFVGANSNTVLNITRCLFQSYNNGSSQLKNAGNTTGLVADCIFRENSYDFSIPAVYNDNSGVVFNKCLFDSTRLVMRNLNNSAPVLNNCVSLHGRLMWNQHSSPTVNNCTVMNVWFPINSTDNLARQELVINEDSSIFRANNTIFWSAKLNPGKQDIVDNPNSVKTDPSTSILTNCLTQNYGINGQNGNIVGKAPRFNRLDYILGPDGRLFTADDGVQLAVCSPAVNAGNATLGTILPTDILGNPRIAGSVIDMGAYELQQAANTSGTYYVNSAATGNNTGTNWNNAYPNLQLALCNACTDTIRVAEGTYKPAVSNRDSTFLIDHPLVLYGGYAAMGSPAANDRDAIKHPTILSGNIGNITDSLDNSNMVLFVKGITDSAVIDGFVIRNAQSKTSGIGINAEGGAGLYVSYSNAGIYNCRFENNVAIYYGGGASIGVASGATFKGCVFSGNSASNYGGALAAFSYTRINGCVFDDNHSYGQGGGIYAKSAVDLNNSVFYRNYTTANNVNGVGGGLYISEYAGFANVVNCSFVENRATSTSQSDMGGGGIYYTPSYSLTKRVANCIFNGNTSAGSTTAASADITWGGYNTMSNSILQYSRAALLVMRLISAKPQFEDQNNPKGPDGIWLTKDDGLQLNYASPAINLGLNDSVKNIPVDILGDARIVLDTVDAGAYEYQNRPVALAGADTTICAGNPVTIGRTGNPKHSYSWTSNPAGFTSTSAAPVVSPPVPTTYYMEVSNGTDITKDTVAVTMSNSLTPTVSVVTLNTQVCAGSPTTFNAIPVYGGADPVYQWQLNGVNAGTDTAVFITPVQNGDKISVQLTSNASCASPATANSNVITMGTTPVAIPQVTINGPLTFCPGDTVTYMATTVDGGPRPIYKWVVGGLVTTTYSSIYTTNTITSSTTMYTELVSNAVCQTKPGATSNSLNIVPKSAVTPSVSISTPNTSICGVQAVTFTASASGGGTNPQWQWKLNGNNTGSNSNTFRIASPANGDNVYVALTSNADCANPPVVESNRLTMAVTATIAPAISITAPTNVTQDSLVTVSATLTSAYGAVTYTWQDSTATHSWQNLTGLTQSIKYAPHQTGDRVRCKAQTTNNCGNAVNLQSAPVIFNVKTITGIDPVPANTYGITCWPNPVNTYLLINGLKLFDLWQTLEITSVDGRQHITVKNIAGQTQVTLTTGSLKAGLYIVTLRKKNGEMAYLKFVKL